METQAKTTAKDFFINLGAVVALYTTVASLVNLLFRVINTAYPKINESYMGYMWNSGSISWPVSVIMVFFPIFILLMWLLEQDYKQFPDKQYAAMHKWFAFISLFVFGAVIAGDLITVLYYFIDGRELTTGFFLKVLVLLIIAGGIFSYYLYDVTGRLTANLRKIYRVVALVIVLGSIVWGFNILGSPRTQQLLKYDQQKVDELSELNRQVQYFYEEKGYLPQAVSELSEGSYKGQEWVDSQTNRPYEYVKTNDLTYLLCAEFNKESDKESAQSYYDYYGGYEDTNWTHPAGRYCFTETIDKNLYQQYDVNQPMMVPPVY
ncbi:MAG: DUF5671 domain-containing protein [bacterium]|nr:DUF5671 domain-containing protein [bacterium]